MRTWVEKLAKRIKKGKYKDFYVNIDDLSISINLLNPTLYIISQDRSASIKLYDDEYDLIKEARHEAELKSKEYFIDLFESYTDKAISNTENDID